MSEEIANETRGEITGKLGDTEIILEPSFEKVEAIETAIGKSVVQLTIDMHNKTNALSFSDVAHILQISQKTRKFNYKQMGNMITKNGLVNAMPLIEGFLESVLEGGAEGNEEAETTTPTE